MNLHKNISQINEQEKSLEKKKKEMEISNMPDKEFKEMIIRISTKLERWIEELRENLNKELKGIIKDQAELKNTITKMKNTLKGVNNILTNT